MGGVGDALVNALGRVVHRRPDVQATRPALVSGRADFAVSLLTVTDGFNEPRRPPLRLDQLSSIVA